VTTLDMISFFAALLFFLAGMWLLRRRLRAAARPAETGRRGLLPFECTCCGDKAVLAPKAMRELRAEEMALAVRSYPAYSGKRFVEHVCPACNTPHWFIRTGAKLAWVGIDKNTAEAPRGACTDCATRLSPPPWSRGAYDHRVLDAPPQDRALGLECPRCRAVVCLKCTLDFSKPHAPKGELWCPRCGRPPMDIFWHPA